MFEYCAERQLDVHLIADARHQPHCRQRMTTAVEKVVSRRKPFDSEQLAPDGEEPRLGLGGGVNRRWLSEVRRRRREMRRRMRKALAVYLAGDRHWQRLPMRELRRTAR